MPHILLFLSPCFFVSILISLLVLLLCLIIDGLFGGLIIVVRMVTGVYLMMSLDWMGIVVIMLGVIFNGLSRKLLVTGIYVRNKTLVLKKII